MRYLEKSFTETGSRMAVARRFGEVAKGELLFNEHRVEIGEGEEFLEMMG